jgi:hypothetical protein
MPRAAILQTPLGRRVKVVEGTQTSAVDRAICAVVRRCVPHARHTLIERAGHMIPLSHPEQLTFALLES